MASLEAWPTIRLCKNDLVLSSRARFATRALVELSRHYGKGLSVDNLAPWVERIRYEGLDLKHLHEKNDALR